MIEHLPKKHRRALVVDGVNTFDDLELVMAERDMPPAPVKTYVIDIPGSHGEVDLTDAFLGDAAYGNREFSFAFELLNETLDIEDVRDRVVALLHGKEKDFALTFDEGYTYRGRFFVDSTKTNGPVQRFVVRVNAQPFKTKGMKTEFVGIHGGVVAYLSSGRKMVQPTFEFSADTVVVFEGRRYVVPAGTWKLEDVWFKEGVNAVTFVDANMQSAILWEELARYTWGEVAEKPLYEWYHGVQKYAVAGILLEGTETPTTGSVAFTIADAEGNTKTSSVDLGGRFLGKVGDVADTLTVVKDTAYLKKVVKDNGDGTYGLLELPESYTFRFAPLYFSDAEVASLTCSAAGALSYETEATGIVRTVQDTTWADYMEGGELAMSSWEAMGAYTWAKLRRTVFETTEEETRVVEEEPMESVYIQYEWSDL